MINAILAIEIGIDPTLVDIAGLEITWHGVFTALGVIAGVAVAAWLALPTCGLGGGADRTDNVPGTSRRG